MQTIGERIRSLREVNGVSQRALARMIDFDHHTVFDVEHGRHLPNAIMLIAIAEAFGVTTDWILMGKEGKVS